MHELKMILDEITRRISHHKEKIVKYANTTVRNYKNKTKQNKTLLCQIGKGLKGV